MKISVIHPSRNRPTMCQQTVRKWITSAQDRENIEYVVSLDSSDTMRMAYHEALSQVPKPHNLNVTTNDNNSAIEAINNAAALVTGDLFVVVSDDFDCPFHWDYALQTMLKDKEDFIVKTDDGAQPWIITLPIMDRKYYNRFGYIYIPLIRHMFADTWMTHVSDLLDKKIILPLKFPHNHYSTGKNTKDMISERNDATWNEGEKIYLDGVRNNFGLTEFSGQLRCDNNHLNWLRSKGITF